MSLQLLLESRYNHLVKIDSKTGCWLWLGSKNNKGYGNITIYCGHVRIHELAHRYFYKLKHGYIPPVLQLDHIVCNNTSCCNPDHVEKATALENVRRSVNWNSIKTHCKYGHEYNSSNTYLYKGERRCKICAKINKRRFRQYGAPS